MSISDDTAAKLRYLGRYDEPTQDEAALTHACAQIAQARQSANAHKLAMATTRTLHTLRWYPTLSARTDIDDPTRTLAEAALDHIGDQATLRDVLTTLTTAELARFTNHLIDHLTDRARTAQEQTDNTGTAANTVVVWTTANAILATIETTIAEPDEYFTTAGVAGAHVATRLLYRGAHDTRHRSDTVALTTAAITSVLTHHDALLQSELGRASTAAHWRGTRYGDIAALWNPSETSIAEHCTNWTALPASPIADTWAAHPNRTIATWAIAAGAGPAARHAHANVHGPTALVTCGAKHAHETDITIVTEHQTRLIQELGDHHDTESADEQVHTWVDTLLRTPPTDPGSPVAMAELLNAVMEDETDDQHNLYGRLYLGCGEHDGWDLPDHVTIELARRTCPVAAGDYLSAVGPAPTSTAVTYAAHINGLWRHLEPPRDRGYHNNDERPIGLEAIRMFLNRHTVANDALGALIDTWDGTIADLVATLNVLDD